MPIQNIASHKLYVEGLYSVKILIFTSQIKLKKIAIETKFDKNSRFDQDMYDPSSSSNILLLLGQIYLLHLAENITESKIRCVIFAENSYQ